MGLNTDFILAVIGGKSGKTAGILKNYPIVEPKGKLILAKFGTQLCRSQRFQKLVSFHKGFNSSRAYMSIFQDH